MEILTNSRQIPKDKSICSNKKYLDILYAYLQEISIVIDKQNYVRKKDVNFSQIGTKLGYSRQTIATKFKNLKDLQLIQEEEGDYYLLIKLKSNIASLVPYPTLKLLVDTLNERSISVYVYLLNLYYANNCQPTQFTYSQIKKFVGITDTTRSNDEIISNILLVLQKIGLIKYSLTAVSQ